MRRPSPRRCAAASSATTRLKGVLKKRGLSTAVGDEGGFAPEPRAATRRRSRCWSRAIGKAGYKPGKDVVLALDVAASELYTRRASTSSAAEKKPVKTSRGDGRRCTRPGSRSIPIVSIEDGMAEGDWKGWKLMTEALGDKIQIVGDDIFVTNPKILAKGIQEQASPTAS